jgi:predicted HTH domain antitoxin
MAAARITTVRLPAEDLSRLTEAAKRLKVERSSLIRRALDKGVREVLTEEAVLEYQRGEASAWAAARGAGLSLWEFLDELKARGVPFRTDEELLREQLAELRASLAKERAHGPRRRR